MRGLWLVLFLLVVGLSIGAFINQKESDEGYKHEIIVRTFTNLKNSQDVKNLLSLCTKNNISIISVAFKQDEDDEVASGELFYPSDIAPTVTGYHDSNLLKELIQLAHERAIMIRAWIPQFHDQVAFKKSKAWQMVYYHDKTLKTVDTKEGEYFVNPLHPQVQAYELSIIKEIITNFDVDAVVLDWVRFDGFNMDLSDYTRERYKADNGYDPIEIDFSKESSRRAAWTKYRQEGIANYIHKVRIMIDSLKPQIDLGLYILSPEWSDLAQDPALFYKDVDFVAPMAYYDDWDYPLAWIYGPRDDAILLLTKQKIKDKVMIPVFDADWDAKVYETIFKHLRESYPQIKTVSWFQYGKWDEKSLRSLYKRAFLEDKE